ncbi:MAG: hypothetical protein ACOX6L_10320 [Syntrophomonadaceae bacterium]|jgi:hypothetical protein
MIKLSKFEMIAGQPNETQIEEWVQTYFFNLMNILNGFFAHVDIQEACTRLKTIPFEQLVKDELEDEQEQTINLAVNKIRELYEAEISFMESWLEL